MDEAIENVIKKFQEYITENQTNLGKHRDIAKKNKCFYDMDITNKRIDDLFMVRYRLEQLLSKIKRNDLCKLVGFQATEEEKERLINEVIK